MSEIARFFFREVDTGPGAVPNVVDHDLFSCFVNSTNYPVDMGLMAVQQMAQLAYGLVAFWRQWATAGKIRETLHRSLKTIEPACSGF